MLELQRRQQQQQAAEEANQNNGSVSAAAPSTHTSSQVTTHNDHSNNNSAIGGSLSGPLSASSSITLPGQQGQQPTSVLSPPESQNTGLQPSNRSQTSTITPVPSLQSSFIIDSPLEDYEDSFILEPQQASSIESAWMEMITRDQPTDVTAVFDRYVKLCMCCVLGGGGWVA